MHKLLISTSTDTTAVGIADDSNLVTSQSVNSKRRHAEELVPLIKLCLENAGLKPSQLDCVVIDIGPGRFTGLRVGIASAIGFCFALDIPAVPVSSLEILANSIESNSDIVAVVDAKRREVYQQVFSSDVIAKSAPVVGSPQVLKDLCEPGSIFVGDAVEVFPDIYNGVKSKNTEIAPEFILKASLRISPVDVIELEPMYLREPDAVPNVVTKDSN